VGSPGWFEKIGRAKDPAAVLALVRQYLDALPADELAHVPLACRSDQLHVPADVALCAFTLGAETFLFPRGNQQSDPDETARMFAEASTHLARIAADRSMERTPAPRPVRKPV